jgi:hypothetical protein
MRITDYLTKLYRESGDPQILEAINHMVIQQDQITELKKALKPFADTLPPNIGDIPPNTRIMPKVTVRHIQLAQKAME